MCRHRSSTSFEDGVIYSLTPISHITHSQSVSACRLMAMQGNNIRQSKISSQAFCYIIFFAMIPFMSSSRSSFLLSLSTCVIHLSVYIPTNTSPDTLRPAAESQLCPALPELMELSSLSPGCCTGCWVSHREEMTFPPSVPSLSLFAESGVGLNYCLAIIHVWKRTGSFKHAQL